MTSLPAPGGKRRLVVIAIAAALFAAAFALRLLVDQSDIEVLLLCVLPIAILAAEFGLLGGLLGAATASALLAIYVVAFDPEVGAWRYATRVVEFTGLAVLVAALAEALRRLALARQQIERESAARHEAERQRAEIADLATKRQRLAQELIAAEDETRRKIAEDLHDGALQTLLAAKQDLVEASRGRAGVTRASSEVSEGIDGLRRAVGALHPLTIEHVGLAGAIGSLAAECERRGRLRCELRIEDEASGSHDRILVSIVRELLVNVVKHSDASQVSVSARRDREWVWVEVADDGRGFDAAERSAAPANGHIGLTCIEDRIEALGGSLEIAGRPGAGAAVSVRLPSPAVIARTPAADNRRP